MAGIAWRQAFANIGAALAGGLDGVFGGLKSYAMDAKLYALSGVISLEATGVVAWGGTWPTRSGYIFVPDAQSRFVFTDLTGTAVANPAFTVGTIAAAYDNIIAATSITAVTLNQIIAAGGGKNGSAATSGSTQRASPELTGTAPHVNVTVAATGGTTCKGRIYLTGGFVPFTP